MNRKYRCTKQHRTMNGQNLKGETAELRSNGYLYQYGTKVCHIRSENGMNNWEEITEFDKACLQSGDKVVYRTNLERFVLKETGTLHDSEGKSTIELKKFTSDLKNDYVDGLDIMKVYRGDKLVFERIEKTPQQIELEKLETELTDITERISKLKGEM